MNTWMIGISTEKEDFRSYLNMEDTADIKDLKKLGENDDFYVKSDT